MDRLLKEREAQNTKGERRSLGALRSEKLRLSAYVAMIFSSRLRGWVRPRHLIPYPTIRPHTHFEGIHKRNEYSYKNILKLL